LALFIDQLSVSFAMAPNTHFQVWLLMEFLEKTRGWKGIDHGAIARRADISRGHHGLLDKGTISPSSMVVARYIKSAKTWPGMTKGALSQVIDHLLFRVENTRG